LPVALGVAVAKYRLHDIDLIINLTLVYGILTALLAGIFEVTVVALQHVLLAVSHV
jgi:transaldolase